MCEAEPEADFFLKVNQLEQEAARAASFFCGLLVQEKSSITFSDIIYIGETFTVINCAERRWYEAE